MSKKMQKVFDRNEAGEITIFGPDEGPIASLTVPQDRSAVSILATGRRNLWNHNEIVDNDGWVYARTKGKKGKRLRKWFTALRDYGYGDRKEFHYWHPKVKDLRLCEEKRWKALEYQNKQIKPLLKVFDEVIKARPFCCMRMETSDKGWPEAKWIIFPKYGNEDRGVSWDWWNSRKKPNDPERPNMPLNQEVGDAWFYYEKRSREVRERVGWFEQIFQMALNDRYAQKFYETENRLYTRLKLNAIINGRAYLLGLNDQNRFGVLAYPNEVVEEIVK